MQISVESLTKRFGSLRALNDITLTIQPGQIVTTSGRLSDYESGTKGSFLVEERNLLVLCAGAVLRTLFSDSFVSKTMRPQSAGLQTLVGKYKKGDDVKIEVKDK